jgi:hypothetical protein
MYFPGRIEINILFSHFEMNLRTIVHKSDQNGDTERLIGVIERPSRLVPPQCKKEVKLAACS